MEYIFAVIRKNIIRHATVYLILLISFIIGNGVALLFLGSANAVLLQSFSSEKSIDSSIYEVTTHNDHSIDQMRDEMDRFKGIADFHLVSYSMYIHNQIVIANQKILPDINILGVSKDYPSIFKERQLAGKWMEKETDVVVGGRIRDTYDLKQGDSIYINGKFYTITGFLENVEKDALIFMMAPERIVYPSLYVKSTKPEDIKKNVSKPPFNSNVKKVVRASEFLEKSWLLKWLYNEASKALIVLLFVLFSMNQIIQFIQEKYFKNLAIFLAVGATPRQVFSLELMKIFLVDVFAIFISGGIVYSLQQNHWFLKKFDLQIVIDYKVLLLFILLSFVCVYLFIRRNLKGLWNKNIQENLR